MYLKNVYLDTVLKEELNKNKSAAKRLKKHLKEIHDIEDIDFGKLFLSLNMQHIHRHFCGTDASLLAIFAVFEFLHNLNALIDDINSERRVKAINKAAGMEICALRPVNNSMRFSDRKNYRPFMIEHYINEIIQLKEGKITVRPEVWNYVLDGKNIADEEKKLIEKQASNEALKILKEPRDIIGFIEKSIEGNYNFR